MDTDRRGSHDKDTAEHSACSHRCSRARCARPPPAPRAATGTKLRATPEHKAATHRGALILATVLALGAFGVGAGAEAAPIAGIRVFPDSVNLTTSRDRQTVVVQAQCGDRTTLDVTGRAEFTLRDPGLVRREGSVFHPAADGETELQVAFAGCTQNVPVRVTAAQNERPVSFKLDVMPVFMKAGCNSGSCHGSARGQDGFRLSLFGYDPDGDYQRITREISERRINLAEPTESLLLQKAVGRVAHTGGRRFTEKSEHYDTLVRWLDAVAPKDADDVATPVKLELLPDRIVLAGEGATQQLVARVTYSDGTDRDANGTAVFFSNNDNSATVSGTGRVMAHQRGEAFVMARYGTFTVGAQVIVVPEATDFVFPDVPAFNYIDGLVYEKLRKLRVAPSDLCTDAEFIRRAFLDVVGLLPGRQEVEAFVADADPAKREKLIDVLLARKEFVELWVMKWAELLQIRSSDKFSYKSALLYYNWLQEKIAGNVPIDDIVRELLSSSGGTFKNPATNFYQVETETLKLAENTAQVFLGMRLQCAQCHNHPFDRWTMNDYYSFAAFFARIGRKPAEDPRETIVFGKGDGEMQHPVDKRNMAPAFLGGGKAETDGRDRRAVLAEWMTAPENPYFARNLANIVWAHFLGRGIVEPVDDVRVSNPASNPELLDELGRRFADYRFDFKRLVRDICTSRTYQLSTRPNDTNGFDDRNFARAAVRRIRAEVLLDCISQVTETKNKFKGLPLGARAVQVADGNVSSYFLTTFGRATRETVCSCEVVMQPNLSQALHLLNGETTQKKIKEGGVVRRLLDRPLSPAQAVEDLYLRCLSRPPTPEEAAELDSVVGAESDPAAAVEDVFWALLNAKEFIFTH
jgi:hypothetical protein